MIKDLFVRMDKEFISETMERSLYVPWDTNYRGKIKSGWIKEFSKNRRFHVYEVEGGISMHIDKTVGKHTILNQLRIRIQEAKRLKEIYRELNPLIRHNPIKTEKKKKIEEFAPNLREIQKNFTPKKYPRTTFWQWLWNYITT